MVLDDNNFSEELDYDSKQRREVFALFGLAMYQAQCWEKSLVILVSTVFNKEYLLGSQEERENFFQDSFKATAGKLASELKKTVKLGDNFINLLTEVVKKRNWLAHDYFWHNAGRILSCNGRDELLKELTEISEYFSTADQQLILIYEEWAHRHGITEEIIQEEMKKYNIEDNI